MPEAPHQDLARTLRDFTDACDRVTDGRPWKSGSPIDVECAHDRLSDEWSQAPSRDAWLAATLRVNAGLDHLRALAVLLSTQQSVFAPATVARAAIEAFGLAHYLAEPGLEPRERVRRYMNTRLASDHEHLRLLIDRPGGQAQADQHQLAEHIRRIERSARRQGLTLHHEGDSRWATWIGSRPPTKTELSAALLSGLGVAGPQVYPRLSATAHGAHHGLTAHVQGIEQLDDTAMGDAIGHFGVSAPEAALHLAGAPLGALHVARRMFPQCGWDLELIQPESDAMVIAWLLQAAAYVPES